MPLYFAEREHKALKKYRRKGTTREEQDKLYKEIIYPAFKKLVDFLMMHLNKKIDDPYDDFRNDTIAHLTFDILPKLDLTKKPFPWFNMCAKTFILQEMVVKQKRKVPIVQAYRKDTNQATLGADENNLNSAGGSVHEAFIDDCYKTIGEEGADDYFNFIINKFKKLKNKSENQQERIVIENVIMILENRDDIDITNKKEFLMILRNTTDFSQREITKYHTEIKKHYVKFHREFYDTH